MKITSAPILENEAMKQLEATLQKMKQALKLDSIHIVQNGKEPKEIK